MTQPDARHEDAAAAPLLTCDALTVRYDTRPHAGRPHSVSGMIAALAAARAPEPAQSQRSR